MDFGWFLTIPGMLITGGVLLLIIALIIFITTSGKKTKKGISNNIEQGNANFNNNVETPSLTDIKPEKEENNGINNTSITESPQNINSIEQPSIPVSPENNNINSINSVENAFNQETPIVSNTPTIPEQSVTVEKPNEGPSLSEQIKQVEPAVMPSTVNPSSEQPEMIPITETPQIPTPEITPTIDPSLKTETTPEIVPTTETPIISTPEITPIMNTSIESTPEVVPITDSNVAPTPEITPIVETSTENSVAPSIYGGASPSITNIENSQNENHQIYGGANPTENTQVISTQNPEVIPVESTPVTEYNSGISNVTQVELNASDNSTENTQKGT